jgi:hypothetical protein
VFRARLPSRVARSPLISLLSSFYPLRTILSQQGAKPQLGKVCKFGSAPRSSGANEADLRRFAGKRGASAQDHGTEENPCLIFASTGYRKKRLGRNTQRVPLGVRGNAADR